MAHKNRFLRIVTSLLLALLIGGLLPAQVFADATPEYISELRIGYDDDEEDAYQSLVDEGFTVMTYNTGYVNNDVDEAYKNYADLNQGGSSNAYFVRRGTAVVYLGYKTTRNKDEAITDIVAMEMNGNYSLVDYETLLNQIKDTQLMPFIRQFTATLHEYRENYNSENPALKAKAQYVHDMLNKFVEDDTGNLLGDMFLYDLIEEMTSIDYFGMSDEKQKRHVHMCKLLLQGNQILIPEIKRMIAAAADTAETNWLDRLSEITLQDMIRDTAEQTGSTQADALNVLAGKYGSTAQKLGSMWEALQSRLFRYMNENDIIYVSPDEDTGLTEDGEALPEEGDDLPDEGGDLPDEGEDLPEEDEDLPEEGEDLSGEGDAAQTSSSVIEPEGYTSVVDMSGEQLGALLEPDDEEQSENADADAAEADDGLEKVEDLSARLVYEVLRDIPYGGGSLLDYFLRPVEDVTGENIAELYPMAAALSEGQKGALDAVTLMDLVQFALSGEGFQQSGSALGEMLEDVETISVYTGVDRTVFSGGTALTMDALRKDPEAVLSFWGWLDKESTVLAKFMKKFWVTWFAISVVSGVFCHFRAKAQYAMAESGAGDFNVLYTKADSNVLDSRLWGGVAVFSMMAYLIAYLDDLTTYYTVDFKTIPQHLINERDMYETDADGNRTLKINGYGFYDVVECNRKENNKNYGKLHNYGDLNGDVGRQWIALYTTKNPAIGEPILASSLKTVVGNANLPAGYTEGLKLMAAKNFLNLTDDHYTWNNETGGIYLYWQRAAETVAGGQASSVSGGTLALSAGGGFLAGGAIGAGVLSMVMKKKKEK